MIAATDIGTPPPGLWLAVEPHFLVSDQGQVWSTHSKRLLKPSKSGEGYLVFGDPRRGSRRYVHHVVCEAFNGPRPTPAHHARHLDGDKQANRFDNLAWGTPTENAADKVAHGTAPRGVRNGMAKLDQAVVDQMRAVRRDEALSYAKIGWRFGVSTMTAFRAATRKAWK